MSRRFTALILALATCQSCSEQELNWDIFSTGTPQQVNAEISKLMKNGSREHRYTKDKIFRVPSWAFLEQSGLTPLMFAAANNPNPGVISILLKSGEDLEAQSFGNDWTPLMFAIINENNPEVIAALLEAGASPSYFSYPDYSGQSSAINTMSDAARSNAPEVITLLLEAGAEIEAGWNDFTPLMCAALDNHDPEVISTLLRAGAEIEAKTSDGRTPLMLAASSNSSEVILALLKAGADLKARDMYGRSVMDYAKSNKNIYRTDADWELNYAFFSQD